MKALYIAIALAAAALPLSAQTLSQDSGTVACPAPTASTPVWGKLVLSGNTVTCFYAKGATTPKTWIQLGRPQTLNMVNSAVLVGMYVTSHDVTKVSTGTIDNFSITPASSFRLADTDIGSPALMGSANLISGVWTLTGSGYDIWGTGDQCNFQPWLVYGDCTVTCRITSLSNAASGANPWEKIGIMIRDGYNSGSDYAMFCATLGNGLDFQYRLGFNENNDVASFIAPAAQGVTSSVNVGYGLTGNSAYQLRP
jgi:hypothetical protein